MYLGASLWIHLYTKTRAWNFKPTLTLEVGHNFVSWIVNTCFKRKTSCIEHPNDLNLRFVYPRLKFVNWIQRLLFTGILKEQEIKQGGEMGKSAFIVKRSSLQSFKSKSWLTFLEISRAWQTIKYFLFSFNYLLWYLYLSLLVKCDCNVLFQSITVFLW